MKKQIIKLLHITLLTTITACNPDNSTRLSNSTNYNGIDGDVETSWSDLNDFTDWADATHSNKVAPNFSEVFKQHIVQRIDITVAYDNWVAMYDDLKANISTSSPGWGGGGQQNIELDFTPIWVPCTITYNNINWYKVGVRFKGNSSLVTSYSQGNAKLSMKLDFDEFEDDYPELKNQRFYGFKQLNLNNNYNDQSFVREKVVSDLYQQFGIPAANTTFCEVYVNYGAGLKYFGLYTIVEEPDDTLVETQFEKGGNLYKPDGDAASFAYGTYNIDEFYPKTNKTTTDYSDLLALYNTLHNSLRTTDAQSWKEQLESIFNVAHFLKYLAVNHTIQNWDTYGRMTHNYYLYNNPSDNLLTWIPWDNNEALQSGNNSIEVSALGSVGSSWPLISYIISQPEYLATYKQHLRDFIELFSTTKMQALYSEYYSLLKNYAYAEQSGYTFLSRTSDFDTAISALKAHVQNRNTVVNNYIK